MRDSIPVGHKAITRDEGAGLPANAITAVTAAGIAISVMFAARTITLADLLLCCIYLEVLAMAAMCLDSGKARWREGRSLPVQEISERCNQLNEKANRS
jgi:hypothetical protein